MARKRDSRAPPLARLQKMRETLVAGNLRTSIFLLNWISGKNRMTISDELALPLQSSSELYVPHIGWLRYPSSDIVLLHLREGSFEFREQAFLWSFLREADTFLDIGAHCGLFSALASQMIGENGRILAFEPNPDILPFLVANTERDKVDVYAMALSDASGEATPCKRVSFVPISTSLSYHPSNSNN